MNLTATMTEELLNSLDSTMKNFNLGGSAPVRVVVRP